MGFLLLKPFSNMIGSLVLLVLLAPSRVVSQSVTAGRAVMMDATATTTSSSSTYFNEYIVKEKHTLKNAHHSPLPYTYIDEKDLPESFSWGNVDGVSYLTHSLNQHIPQCTCVKDVIQKIRAILPDC